MSNQNTSNYEFSPRPEAHAMDWEDLMSPIRYAIRNLLVRIQGAIASQRQDYQKKEKAVTNCFLVYGDRGTGKSTVLHSVKYACSSDSTFFEEKRKGSLPGHFFKDENIEGRMREEAEKSAQKLNRAEWLDVLDLEPLPPRTNLLTTVLTRVRNALCPADDKASILEESATSARHQLDQLINDATLMWEDILEPDTRGRANRQVAAADIYAHFHKRFKAAIEKLSLELGRRRGSRDEHRPIVLRIDNIDRSTDHLYNIVRLAEMVSCAHLWVVMAGDRRDVDTFLERAYWKELMRIGEGAGATVNVKPGVAGEDEALVMARRQAAAASHRLLPPSHRVEVHLVDPEETLSFTPSPKSQSGQPNGKETIRELLERIPLDPKKEDSQLKLIDCFDTQKRLERAVGKKKNGKLPSEYLTDAARLGLRLPARGVLDLWQLADWIANGTTIPDGQKAAEIARIMLRNVIAESPISSEMGQHLQALVIRRNPQGGTILDLRDPATHESTLTVIRLKSLKFKLPPYPKKKMAAPYEVRSWLSIHQLELTLLRLSPTSLELPNLVAGWLIVLYDVLVEAEYSHLIRCCCIPPSAVVRCEHKGVSINEAHCVHELEQVPEWPLPCWQIFLVHEIAGKLWQHFLCYLEDKELLDQAGREGSLSRLLATGWVACALDTFSAFAPGTWNLDRHNLKKFVIDRISSSAPEGRAEAIKRAEEEVMNAAANCYAEIDKNQGTVYRAEGETLAMRTWLERQLPLLLNPLFVPMTDEDAAERVKGIMKTLESTELATYWRDNTPYIISEIESWLLKLFPAGSDYDDKTSKRREKQLESLKSLGPFFNLDGLRGDSKPAGV